MNSSLKLVENKSIGRFVGNLNRDCEMTIVGLFNTFDKPTEIEIEHRITLLKGIIERRDLKNLERIHGSCKACKGVGFRPIFNLTTVMKPCLNCGGKEDPYTIGTGWKVATCKKCNGTGFKDGDTCDTCKGHAGIYIYHKAKAKGFDGIPCKVCGDLKKGKPGSGLVKRMELIDRKVKKTVRCKVCGGTGRAPSKKEKVLTAPLISADIAEALNKKKEVSSL